MHPTAPFSPFVFLLLLATTDLGATQEQCPAKCDMAPVDGDRVLSDCTAQCNTSYGDPEEAQTCIDYCNGWENVIECEVPLTTRKRSSTQQRRRGYQAITVRDSEGQSFAAESESFADAIGGGYGDDDLTARDGWSACIAGCRRPNRLASLCPKNSLQVVATIVESAISCLYRITS